MTGAGNHLRITASAALRVADLTIAPWDDTTALLRWSAVPGATGYRIYAATTADFQNLELVGTTTDTHYTATAEPLARYFYVTADF